MSRRLGVFREFEGALELVGQLARDDRGATTFSYAPSYLASPTARPISASLPLSPVSSSLEAARAFFDGLLPEGEIRKLMTNAFRLDSSAYDHFLSRLNNESVGALVFAEEPYDLPEPSYKPLAADRLASLTDQPVQVALDLSEQTRLSLAGAQTKIGLFRPDSCQANQLDGWYLPLGSAPSTHIIKAQSPLFPLIAINEALSLETARNCGFEVAKTALIRTEATSDRKASMLLAVERFDRTSEPGARNIGGMPAPLRLHQEDFSQAAGLGTHLKYEPTDGHYLSLCASIINRVSSNPFGDRAAFFSAILFDYLIGNCDNHLKNHSLLWSADWSRCELSPLYDVVCTTMYPTVYREMGVSLCPSRRIDDVTAADVRQAARSTGISERMGWNEYKNLCEMFLPALEKAEASLVEQGYPEASEVASYIRKEAQPRLMLG